ncbi:MAG TPA: hypothetical protein VMB66_07400 [Candidatus Acidoferrales bacterium]|nr:hypothetical protein [Candidatus Acidoferrales bacterium]
MNASAYALLLSTAALMATANFLIKHGIARVGGFTFSVSCIVRVLMQPAVALGFVTAGAAAIMWFQILSTQKLAICYPIFVALTFAFVTIGAMLFFRESLSVQKIAGLVTMVVGIVFVARG